MSWWTLHHDRDDTSLWRIGRGCKVEPVFFMELTVVFKDVTVISTNN